MRSLSQPLPIPIRRGPLAWLPLAFLLLAGCGREEVAVYDAPKEAAAAPTRAENAPAGMDQMPARPGLRWKSLPAGWTSTGPAGMRVANFALAGEKGAAGAELAAIPLPGTGGNDLDLVNLWRGQLALAPITEADLKSHTDEMTVAGQPIRLFNIVGSSATDTNAAGNQILVAAIRRDGFTWFFKMSGDSASVAAHRDRLKAFLPELEFTAPAATAPMMAAASRPGAGTGGGSRPGPEGGDASSSQPKAEWESPPSWQSVQAPQMVFRKWTYADPKGGKADITVSVFPGETGGLSANLNRWRAQVGLAPAPDAELRAFADNTDVLGGKATLVDFTGSSPESGDAMRIVAAVVRREGWSWFYKILGADAAVQSQRDAFLKFVQTVKYTSGP